MASSATWNDVVPPRRRVRTAALTLLLTVLVTGGLIASAIGILAWGMATQGAPDPAGGPEAPAAAPDERGDRDDTPTAEPPVEEIPDEPIDVIPVEEEPVDETAVDETPVDDDEDAPVEEAPDDEEADEDEADEDEADEDDEDEAAALSTLEVQQRLQAYGFLVGAADGEPGQQTTAAVMAFQRVNGLSVDGVVGPATTAALLAGSAEPELAGGPADRIEVDLDRQLLHLVEGGERIVTLQVSSGSGETYTNASGQVRARTPVGRFVIERRVHGLREAALGTLYDPLYFHRGFAIHGSPSVPAYPASHGCVRITRADAAWLIQRVPDGMPVHLYGGDHVFAP